MIDCGLPGSGADLCLGDGVVGPAVKVPGDRLVAGPGPVDDDRVGVVPGLAARARLQAAGQAVGLAARAAGVGAAVQRARVLGQRVDVLQDVDLTDRGHFGQAMVPEVPAPLARNPAPSIQNAGQYPAPSGGLGCLIEAMTSISPPAGAAKVLAVSIRPEVQRRPDFTGLMSRWPWPSSDTFAVERVADSTSPVPQLAGQPEPL